MIFICTYSNGNVGLAQELQRYLIRKKESFYLLLHPLTLKNGKSSILEVYRDGEMARIIKSIPSPSSQSVHYFRCLLTTFWSLLFHARSTHLFIAFSNVDAVAGLLCRIFFKFKIVYVSTDYPPKRRFENFILNTIYNTADRWAYRWCDVVWHMYPERGQLKKYKHRTRSYDVLDGNNFRRIERLPIEKINPFRMVYIGQINRDCRLEESIEAVAHLKGEFPRIGLDLIYSGDVEYESRLKKLANDLGIQDRVTFHGQIRSPEIYEPIITQCGLGLCLYEISKDDLAWYGTPLKVYMYAACGLPSILSITMGPFTKEYVEQDHIGVMVSRGELDSALRKIFKDQKQYNMLRESSISWAAKFDYEDKFDKYLSLI